MGKKLFLLAAAVCLSACYSTSSRKTVSTASAPTHQPVVLQPAEEQRAALPEQQTEKYVSATEPETTKPQRDITPPPISNPSAVKPIHAPNTEKAAVSTDQTIQPNTEPTEKPAAEPAPDQPVFDNEKLIDTKDRVLHPYAALAPDEKALQTAPWAYEQLKYGIYYGFVKAGTAYIRNRGLVSVQGRTAYLLQTTAFSASVIDAVFKVRDINQSWLDATDLYSHGYGQSVREGNYRRDEWLSFDYTAGHYSGLVQKKEAPRAITGPLEIPVLDMLSSLYYVRAQKLQIGRDIIFDIINREKQYPLIVKVLKKETVKTAAGKFNCIVVEPQIRGEGIFVAKGKSLKVWLTDDVYKMPVKMSVEVFIGSVSAELLEYKRQAPINNL